MLPPGNCFGGDTMMLWPFQHSAASKTEHIWHKVHACIWYNFLWNSKCAKYNLRSFHQVICCETASFFYNRKHEVLIYSAEKCFILTNLYQHQPLTRFAWYFTCYCLLMCLCLLVLQACCMLLYSVFNVCIHIHPINRPLAKHLFFSVPIWLLYNCSNICLWNRNGIIILLPFTTMPLIIASSCQIDKQCCILCSNSSLFCVASLVLCKVLAFGCLHPVRLPSVYLLWCAHKYIHWCADGIHVYAYGSNFLVPVFYMVVPE